TGSNIRMARSDGHGELQFWPYADGLFDVEMEDVDDAAVIRRGLCQGLRFGDPTCTLVGGSPSPSARATSAAARGGPGGVARKAPLKVPVKVIDGPAPRD